jgi:GT2 family glycosyltransferase
MEFNLGVVIPVGKGRDENVRDCLTYLLRNHAVQAVMLVLDGEDVPTPQVPPTDLPVYVLPTIKHRPGMEQPRNLGVRHLVHKHPDITHVWFLDSDILVLPDCADHYAFTAFSENALDAVLIGPYDWMPAGRREPMPDLETDWRWAMFREKALRRNVADLGVALGNFSGNLVWPVEAFMRVGGFHPQLHHGRCEDGELGLRAAAAQVPMVLVPGARGWHMAHDVNHQLVMDRNARDVPLLNQWHPWVEGMGLIVTHEDGARFDFVCECGEQMNTLLMWEHFATRHHGTEAALHIDETRTRQP